LKLDADSVRGAIEGADRNRVVQTFAELLVDADVDVAELEELRQLAKTLSGVGLRLIDGASKAAQKKRAEQRAKDTRARQQAARCDPRPMIAAPFSDQPFLPTMRTLDEVIGGVAATIPPLRDIDTGTARTRKFPIPTMHEFASSEANNEEDEA
jgi:hypothetical protein